MGGLPYGDGQRLLTPTQGAEVRDRPVQTDKHEQALYEPRCLPQRQTEQDLQGQAGLNGCSTVGLLTSPPARRCRLPLHLGVEPDQLRSAPLQ